MKLSDYFDKIFIIGALNSQKVNHTIDSLKKLDLYDENVMQHIYTPTKNIHLKCQELPDYGFDNYISIILAQYTVVKQAYDAGMNSVLILEDDNSFLKDITKWEDILNNLPEDWDVIRFAGYTVNNECERYLDFNGERFLKFDANNPDFINIWGTSALGLNRRGMETYINSQEHMMRQVDHVNDIYFCSKESDMYFLYEDCGNKPMNIYFTNYSLFCPLNDIYKYNKAFNYVKINEDDYLVSDEDVHFINSKKVSLCKDTKFKTCVITMSKNAVDIYDWCNHYLSLGFNHIFLFDNNDYSNRYNIEDERITTIRYPSEYKGQLENKTGEWRQCYLIKIGIMMAFDQDFDYCFICDDDEYLNFNGNYNCVNDFLIKYNYYDSISVHWDIMDDNDYIYIKDEPSNIPLRERYNRSSGLTYRNKSFYRLPKSWEVLQEDMKIMYDIMHQVTDRRSITVDMEDASVKHYITFCMERFLLHKGMYNGEGSNKLLDRQLLRYFAYFNNLTEKKVRGYIDLCNKYNIPISDDDRMVMKEKGIYIDEVI